MVAASGTSVAVSSASGTATLHGLAAKAAVQYSDLNVGVETVVPIKRVVQYMDFNVGLEPIDVRDADQYTDFNVGLEPAPRIGSEYADFNFYASTGQFHRGVYADFNVDPTTPPVPHIWYVKPQYGKEGLLFNVVGMGFGTTQAEFDGHVQLGTLDCPVNKWELTPAQTSRALRVGGYPTDDADWVGSSFPHFTTNSKGGPTGLADTVILNTGDIIEMYYVNRTGTPRLPSEIAPYPHFDKLSPGFGSNWVIDTPDAFPGVNLLVDTEGRNWTDPIDTPAGQIVYRKFIVPAAFNGKATANWGAALKGQSTVGRPPRVADFGRFVLRSSDGTPKLWVTLDDGTPPDFGWLFGQSYDSNVSTLYWSVTALQNAPWLPNFIDYGASNVENEWVVVIVPDGAESGMVKVVLEDT